MLGFESGFSFLLQEYRKNQTNDVKFANYTPLRLLYIDSFYYKNLLMELNSVKNMNEDDKLKVQIVVELSINTSNKIHSQQEEGQVIEMDVKVKQFEEKCKEAKKFLFLELTNWLPIDNRNEFLKETQLILENDFESFIQLFIKYFQNKIITYYTFVSLFECTMLWMITQDLTPA